MGFIPIWGPTYTIGTSVDQACGQALCIYPMRGVAQFPQRFSIELWEKQITAKTLSKLYDFTTLTFQDAQLCTIAKR
jgi:hypothetical protein